MSERESENKQPSEADAELEREIRQGRKFTLAEAIGRTGWSGCNERRVARPSPATGRS